MISIAMMSEGYKDRSDLSTVVCYIVCSVVWCVFLHVIDNKRIAATNIFRNIFMEAAFWRNSDSKRPEKTGHHGTKTSRLKNCEK